MRTTIDLDPDVLAAAKEMARTENLALGKVVSRLVRQAMTGAAAPLGAAGAAVVAAPGFQPFPARGDIVTNELIDRLRDAEGV